MATATAPARARRTIEERVNSLDLDCIKIKLMDATDGPAWSREHADLVERLYRRFLIMNALSDQPIVPTKPIDEFWHHHILDTAKYAADCDIVFGQFLDHFPYFGLRGAEDAANLQRSFAETGHLYRQLFGDDYEPDSASQCNAGKCGGACGGSHCRSGTTDDRRLMRHHRPTLD